MRDRRAELGLTRQADWPRMGFVFVAGASSAGTSVEEWGTIAVIKAIPPDSRFYVGFKRGDRGQRLRVPVETIDGLFGMRVRTEDVEFFAVPLDETAGVELELVELTSEDDGRYADLPLY